ncbi:MAG: magnesium transporter [Rhodobacteraceae bacterium]|nr:magnesium transporter [Paracoccaceae bacterium]
MLQAFGKNGHGLIRLDVGASLDAALWIDLLHPTEDEVARVARFGLAVPTLSEMEEIEISNRLYREDGADYLTVVLPGLTDSATPITGPVTFMLMPGRLVTVRHHTPRPFDTYPTRADKATSGCASSERVFLGLTEEIVARLADILEGVGHALDRVTRDVFGGGAAQKPEMLQQALEQTGRQGDLLGRVRLCLLTLERALSYFGQTLAARHEGEALGAVVKGQMRDMQALEVHADFLSSRVGLAVDATLGMVNLAQNVTVRIVSVVAVLFLPPTLIASIYGMNFAHMPELADPWGYPIALALMVASAVGTYFFFKWRHWL